MVYLTRRVEFSAAHTLYDPGLDQAGNERCYGKCGRPHGHGHNYVLEVTVRGEVDPRKGFFINVDELKELLDREVVELLDHSNLNADIEFFANHRPTGENISKWIWDRLQGRIDGCELYRIRLFETRNNYVEYFGDEDESETIR